MGVPERSSHTDGTFERSSIRFARLRCKQVEWFVVPASHHTYRIIFQNGADHQDSRYTTRLYNEMGVAVRAISSPRLSFETIGLASGVYVIRLFGKEGEDHGSQRVLIP